MSTMMNDLAQTHDADVRRAVRDLERAREAVAGEAARRRCGRAVAVRRVADRLGLPLRTRIAARAERVCATC